MYYWLQTPIGTPRRSEPPALVNAKALDVWSSEVVLFQMLHTTLPFMPQDASGSFLQAPVYMSAQGGMQWDCNETWQMHKSCVRHLPGLVHVCVARYICAALHRIFCCSKQQTCCRKFLLVCMLPQNYQCNNCGMNCTQHSGSWQKRACQEQKLRCSHCLSKEPV